MPVTVTETDDGGFVITEDDDMEVNSDDELEEADEWMHEFLDTEDMGHLKHMLSYSEMNP